jgi:hypothetical protein
MWLPRGCLFKSEHHCWAAAAAATAAAAAAAAAAATAAVVQADFRKAKEKVLYKKKEGVPEGLYM